MKPRGGGSGGGVIKTLKPEPELEPDTKATLKEEERQVGDGAPANEIFAEDVLTKQLLFGKKLSLRIEIDLMVVVLLVLGLVTRFYKLQQPKNIVFDELHYGRYISLYMKNIFFFDSHPPLGKQMLSAAAYLAGYNGNYTFDKIGSSYTDSVPIFSLRFIPALCGSLLPPLIYNIMLLLRYSEWTSIITALLIVCDNALLTQSRFMLMESMLLLFGFYGIYCLLKFKFYNKTSGGYIKWVWFTIGCVSLTCCTCIKFSGFYSCLLGFFLLGREFWNLLGDRTLISKNLFKYVFHIFFIAVVVPTAIYVSVFAIHLNILTKAGPHDTVMTSAFQASLEGGLASITKGQPSQVSHGSQITLRHTHGRTCWLHSHALVYPIKYPDKRGSSHQQQVTCYSFKDVNNWWIVKRPEKNDLTVAYPIDPIKDGDVIQLVHGITSRALNSHDVAAPMSPQCQEVSCYIDYNVSMPAQNLWRVEIINKDKDGAIWNTIQSLVHLIHVNSGLALKFSGRQLPDWGFHQHEVVADKVINQDDTIWNVEEHRYTKTDDKKERERQLVNAEMIPTSATHLSFWEKFMELQYKMLFANQEYVQNHMFSSEPLEWPLLTRGIAYWVSSDSNAQIHLIGNLIIWYSSTLALILYFIFLSFYLIRRRRLCYDLSPACWEQFIVAGEVFVVGYMVHFLPYFFMERTLFLHHYLPAFVFNVLLLGAVIEHVYIFLIFKTGNKRLSVLFVSGVVVWFSYVVQTFLKFSVLNYGTTDLTESNLVDLRWRDTWDFILHKK